MGNILRSPINNNAIFLTPRTASHSLVLAAIEQWWPNTIIEDINQHPARCIPSQENLRNDTQNLGIIVRNPIERFRSMIAYKNLNIEQQLVRPLYGPLPDHNWDRIFKFETELDMVVDWLGLIPPLPQIDATNEDIKPILTTEQENIVKNIYQKDIILWESLQ